MTAATALAVTAAVFSAGLSPVAIAAETTDDPALTGSFGQPDEFAAVVNQSLALMAFVTAGQTAPPDAVTWLLAQQCEDGSFVAYRSDVAAACPDPDPTQVTGKDSNSTAYAAMALAAVGESHAAGAAVDWLAGVQEEDGGWSFVPGSGTDPNSTGLVTSAFTATGRAAPAGADEALLRFALGCDAAEADRGAFVTAFDPSTASPLATAQSVIGAAGAALPVAPQSQSTEVPTLTCPDSARSPRDAAEAGAGWLAARIEENGGFVPQDPAFGDGPDAGVTTESIMAMVATGCCATQTQAATDWLAQDYPDYVAPSGRDSAGALAKTALAFAAADARPDLLGEVVLRLESLRLVSQAATSALTASPTPSPTDETPPEATPTPTAESADDATPSWVWWLVGAGVLAAVGIGPALLRRRSSPG